MRSRPAPSVPRSISRGRLLFHECQQIGAPEPALTLAAHTQARQPTGIGPATQRRLADLEELSSLLDVQKLVLVAHRSAIAP